MVREESRTGSVEVAPIDRFQPPRRRRSLAVTHFARLHKTHRLWMWKHKSTNEKLNVKGHSTSISIVGCSSFRDPSSCRARSPRTSVCRSEDTRLRARQSTKVRPRWKSRQAQVDLLPPRRHLMACALRDSPLSTTSFPKTRSRCRTGISLQDTMRGTGHK